jgi:ssDNA-binding Zn-finger/Zn-ribbon topoisomerase 1
MIEGQKRLYVTKIWLYEIKDVGDGDEEEEDKENIGMNVEENIVGDYDCPECIFSSKAEKMITNQCKKGVIVKMVRREIWYIAL